MRLIYTFLLFLFIIPASLLAAIPATEIRAAWITTNWGLDWPKIGSSVEAQKQDLIKILDELKRNNFNVVLFQARAQGSVFYNSKIEPKSPYYNHEANFDPLAFVIEESHKRGLECHAWLITFPMGSDIKGSSGRNPLKKKPDYYKLVNKQWYLDPGRPETRKHLLSLVKEIVANYDIDGLHFDYIRYPSANKKFPDADTFRKYGNGSSLDDWRRDNINKLVAEIYDTTKALKKWVQVSSSPLGRYKPLPEIRPNDGWNAYEIVYQDAGKWMQDGKHDILFPMLYYKGKDFYPYLDDWLKYANGRPVIPGIGIYQMMDGEQKWDLAPIVEQMEYTRAKNIPGQAYFRVGNYLDNLKGIKDAVKDFYPHPAKLPAMTWLENKTPAAPLNMEAWLDANGFVHLKWDNPDDKEEYVYTIYTSMGRDLEDADKKNPECIFEAGIRGNSYSFEAVTGEFGYYYSVSASDRYHNESKLNISAFVVHSDRAM